MALVLAILTFVVVGGILLAISFLATRAHKDGVVRRRLESLQRAQRRGSVSPELDLLREELYSSVPFLQSVLMLWPGSIDLKNILWQAGMKNVKPAKILLFIAVIGMGSYVGATYLFDSQLAAIGIGLAGASAPCVYVMYRRIRRLRAFEKLFPEAIDLLGRAVRAGHAFTTGLEMIGKELPQPVAEEFRVTFEEQNFGLPLKDALFNLAERVPLIDVRFFVIALLIQKETGGNLAEILDNLSRVIRERFKILGEVRIKTAQGRLTAGILIGLPPLMMLMMSLVNPEYIKPLFEDVWGPYVLVLGGAMQIIGSAMLWKIVQIDV
jgi:tight adherence protein B